MERSVYAILQERFPDYLLKPSGFAKNRVIAVLGNYTEVRPVQLSLARGLRVLDVASGSMDPDSYERPSFAFAMAHYGALVTGIDKGAAIDETKDIYTHLSVDLVDVVMNGSLARIPQLAGQQFDIVNCTRFVDPISPAPGLEGQLAKFGTNLTTFAAHLKAQMGEMIADGGVLALDLEYYRKAQGVRVQIEG